MSTAAAPQRPLAAIVMRNVREARRARRWSAADLAAKVRATGCPLDRSILANMETGRRRDVSVDQLWAFAEVLETTPEYLATNVGPACARCQDAPPAGFSCLACGKPGEITEEEATR